MNKKVTAWYKIVNKDGELSFNHLEDGWVEENKPKPIKEEYTNQLAWQNEKWTKKYCYLENGVAVDA